MSKANDLIERMEQETGQRIDSNDGNNAAMAGLFGALSRALGKSSHQERDDVAAGMLIRHKMTPEFEQEQRQKQILADMLSAGLSPDDIKNLMDKAGGTGQ